jgi:hypothetical protein
LWIFYLAKALWIVIIFTSLSFISKSSIAIKVAIVDNTKSAIQVGGHTPRMVLLDTGAQPVIFGIQFVKKMGMLDSKLRKSMWQIHAASGSV